MKYYFTKVKHTSAWKLVLLTSLFWGPICMAQNVTINDSNFKSYLVGNTSINTNADSEIQVTEAAAFTGTIAANNLDITDLTGIEAFTSLTVLNVNGNDLTTLDLSSNVALEEVYLVGNRIVSLDFSGNPELRIVDANSNVVTNSVDITQNPDLESLRLSTSSITTIDVTQNVALTHLWVNGNQLTSLNLSQNIALTNLDCGDNEIIALDLSNNPSLEVLTAGKNILSSINIANNPVLDELALDDNQLSVIDVTQNTMLTSLSVTENPLTSIDLTQNQDLIELYMGDHNLSGIDLSQNVNIEFLTFETTPLISLDLSTLVSLTYLEIYETNITILDLSQNTNLEELYIGDNQLISLNLANGNNTNMIIDSYGHTNLSCVEVDDVAYSTANWTDVEEGISFSLDCQDPFVTTWKTDNPGTSGDDQITIPVLAFATTGYIVDWGDGTVTSETLNGITHSYASSGTYTVKILGDLQALSFDNGGDKDKLLSIENWGDIAWTRMDRAYRGCSNLVVNASDAPDLSSVSSMQMMFFGASAFNQSIDHWDVSNVTDMSFVFAGAISFDQPLNSWDVSNAITMSSMFSSATSFNRPLDNWMTSSLENTSFMFSQADAFNQDINNWDMDLVINMESMFNRNDAFNQPLNEWDVSKVTNLTRMFTLATAFDQSLGDWDISMVTQMFDILDNTNLSIENYDNTLIGWSELTVQDNIRLEAFGVQYCNGLDARDKLINDFNWTIIDGGQECGGVEITWDGSSWSNNSGPSADGTNDVIIDGNYDYEAHGELYIHDLIINGGSTVSVNTEEPLQIENELTNNGSIIIESGATLITYETGSISGNPVLIKRNTRYDDGRYSFVGTPVEQDPTIIGSDLGSFVFKYNETTSYGSNDGLSRWEDASIDELIPGKGYTQAEQQELIFSGTPNTGEITYNGSYTEDTDDANEGWNLVANPYPAAINVSDFLAENTNTSGAVYIWDDNGSNIQRGSNSDYIVANAVMATSTAAGGQSRYNFHLGSAQGFFVQLEDAIDTEIVFTEDMRVEDANSDENFFRTAPIPIARINLINTKGLFRQTVVGFADDASKSELNTTYDAKAFNAKVNLGIFTLKAGRTLALNGVLTDWDIIQLQVNIAEAGTYSLELELENYNNQLYLIDNLSGEVIDITNRSYSFHADAGIHTNRFELLSNPSQILGVAQQEVLAYAYEKILFIKTADQRLRQYQLFDLHGKMMFSREVQSNTEIDLSSLNKGIYLLYDGTKTHKILLK